MRNIVSSYVEKFRQERRKRRMTYGLLLAVALVVTASVAWQLHSTGIAMTDVAYCGSEEHQHDESCYELVLVCGLEEGEVTSEISESASDEGEGAYEESEDAYETGEVVTETCEGHIHTEECYELQMVCGKEEHTHTVECMSNENSDVETADDWKATLPDLTGVWAEDVVAVAKSQLGYTESFSNFILADDGETRKGYTRYGAWYGNEYGDWDAMFASFCLYYAGVDESAFPEASGAYAWAAELEKLGLYADAAAYTPASGNLVFFDMDGDGKADHVGIASAVSENTLTVIEGDYEEGDADAVCMNEYSLSDSSVLGYGMLPVQEGVEAADSMDGETDEESEVTNGEETADGSETALTETGNEKTVLTYEGEDYAVTVSYGEDAALPENVELIVSEYDKDSETYQTRYAEAAELYGWVADHTDTVRLFNIGLYADGEEVEPAAEVDVTITLLEKEEESSYDVIHFGEEATEAVEAVSEYEDGEQSVTFQVDGFSDFLLLADEGTTEQGNIGAKLDGDYAYLSDVAMVEDGTTTSGYAMRTGTSPWDENDDAGNDSTDLNNSLRTYDIATYTVTFTSRVRDDAPYKFYYEGNLYFEFIIQGGSNEVQFETGSMGWLDAKNATYYISEEEVNGVTCQVLRGYYSWQPASGNDHAIGESTQELTLAIRVLAMSNGDTVQPTFTFWLYGNEVGVDYTDWGASSCTGKVVTGSNVACSTHSNETECQTIAAPSISVSAVASYNVAITADTTYTAVGSYDFSTGNDSALNKNAGTVYGRLGSYGITIQIIGKTGQGLRGIELPKSGSDITFTLSLTSQYAYTDSNGTSIEVDTSDTYTPLIWSLEENRSGSTQNDGRTVSSSGTTYARSAPYNSSSSYNSCYSGGSWTAEENIDGTVSVTISGCVISTDMSNIPYTSASGTRTTTTYYDPDTIDNYWELQTFCISAGEVWIVQPYYEYLTDENGNTTATYIVDEYGSSGTFTSYLTDTSLMMETESGATLDTVDDNSNQAITTDDSKTLVKDVTSPGSIVQTIQYLKVGYTSNSDPLTEGCENDGKDWILQGNYLVIENGISHDAAEGGNTGVAYDQLVKFDDAFFQPTSCDVTGALWGAKPDKTGWNHTDADGNTLSPDDEGYDTEMINATTDDLVFFDSLEELEEAGYTCVAVLVERRSLQTTQMNHLHMHITGYAKYTAEVDQVYMITQYCRAWDRDDLVEAINAAGVSMTLADLLAMSNSEVNALIKQYIPSRTSYTLAEQIAAVNSTDRLYNNYPSCFWINGGSDGNSGQSNAIRNYEKVSYENGAYAGGDAGVYWGDSCLLVGYTTGVALNVAQTTTGGAEKSAYDMDTSQRIVDYALQGNITRNSGEGTTSGQTLITDVTMTVTLPVGLTYLENSSYIGGTHVTNGEGVQGTVTGGTQLLENDTVTVYDDNGNALYTVKLELVGNADGTTTLTYTLTGITVTSDLTQYLDTIHFSCQIGTAGNEDTDVKNGDSLVASAAIESTEDCNRPATATNGNYSEVGIQISKNNAVNLAKFADQSVVEIDGDMSFEMYVGNNSVNAKSILAVDSLPYEGDGVSSFTGDVEVTGFRIYSSTSTDTNGDVIYNYNASDFEEITFYYTTNTNYRGNDSATLEAAISSQTGFTTYSEWFENSSDWNKLTIDSDGVAALHATDFKPVAIVAVGNLKASTTLKMHIAIKLSKGKGGDIVVNTLTNDNLSCSAQCKIVSRSLSGLAWVDVDGDGVQDTGEISINSVTVKLLKLNDGGDATKEGDYTVVATTTTGNTCDVQTNKETAYTDGYYQFTSLSEGTYAVRFTTPSGTTVTINDTANTSFAMADYVASPVDVGSTDEDDKVDSDATGTYSDYTLSQTLITGIDMPAASTLTYGSYASDNHDSGFFQYQLQITKVDYDVNSTLLEGVSFELVKMDSTGTSEDNNFTKLTGNTDASGIVTFGDRSIYSGLAAGIYKLTETQTKAGYNSLTGAVKITIGTNGSITAVNTTDTNAAYTTDNTSSPLLKVTVTNKLGVELPLTGGTGAYPYVMAGLLLISSAVYLLFRIQRRRKEELY